MPNSNEQDTPQQSAMDGLTRQFGEAFSAEETIAETLRGGVDFMADWGGKFIQRGTGNR
jgi:hypothetical protein